MDESAPFSNGWPPPAYDAAAAAGAALEQVRQTFALSRGLASAARPIDLAGLDRSVGVLCAKVLDLPVNEGRDARILLIELLSELDALSATLRAGAP